MNSVDATWIELTPGKSALHGLRGSRLLETSGAIGERVVCFLINENDPGCGTPSRTARRHRPAAWPPL